VDVCEGHADELSLNNGADVCEVDEEVVHVAAGRACCDGCLDLVDVLLGFTKEFFGFPVTGGARDLESGMR
jgi:hypothetical protein